MPVDPVYDYIESYDNELAKRGINLRYVIATTHMQTTLLLVSNMLKTS